MPSSSANNREIFFFAASLTAFRIFTNFLRIFTQTSGTGAPVSALVSGILVLLLVFFTSSALKTKNLIEYSEKTFGKAGKHIISAVLLVFLLLSSIYTISEFTLFAQRTSFPTTPQWFIALFFIVAATLAAAKGIKSLLRVSVHFLPFFFTVIFIILGSVLVQCDFKNLLPLSGNGIQSTYGKGLSGAAVYSDILLFFLINPPCTSAKKSRRCLLWGSFLGIFTCVAVIFTFTAKIPYPLSKDEQFPFYLLMKEVYYGRFFQRLDAIVLLVSSLWGMLSLSFNLCLMTKIMRDTFGITPASVILFPLSSLIFFTSSLSPEFLIRLLLLSAILTVFFVLIILIRPRKEAPPYEN